MYKIGVIGCGKMAKAILSGACRERIVNSTNIIGYEINQSAKEAMQVACPGMQFSQNIPELVKQSEIIMISVKPHIVASVFSESKTVLDGKAVFSIAAGVTTAQIRSMAPESCRVLRVMPNMPAMVAQGMTTLSRDTTFTDAEKEFAQTFFDSIGKTIWLPESLMDAATAINGSGPAYAFMFIEALADGGVREGLPRDIAYQLATQTLIGSAVTAQEMSMHPGELKDAVCSPGGTTIEAVYALEKGGFRASLMDAVHVCTEKCKNLNSK